MLEEARKAEATVPVVVVVVLEALAKIREDQIKPQLFLQPDATLWRLTAQTCFTVVELAGRAIPQT